MIAIRISGMWWPPTVSANTSLGFGHGTVVEMRTFMYEVRKHEKMNVSLSRKIHIIALPHGTGKACLSADQSAATPCRPSGHCGQCTTASIASRRLPYDVRTPGFRSTTARPNNTSQTSSRKCQYTVHSSTLEPHVDRARRRCAHARAAVRPQTTARRAGAGRARRSAGRRRRPRDCAAAKNPARLQLLPRVELADQEGERRAAPPSKQRACALRSTLPLRDAHARATASRRCQRQQHRVDPQHAAARAAASSRCAEPCAVPSPCA